MSKDKFVWQPGDIKKVTKPPKETPGEKAKIAAKGASGECHESSTGMV